MIGFKTSWFQIQRILRLKATSGFDNLRVWPVWIASRRLYHNNFSCILVTHFVEA